ncbi:tetratricopeptide repeat protein [Streptomyces sp. NPDC059076]|uniref:tetratricopeptide repeat protein n=1 Tax=unclassified Streptomyces TaxID=2593676 RepID=UPI00368F1B63
MTSQDGVDVFVNYRTADTGYGAAACYELLSDAFGAARIFRDCVTMLPGEPYPDAIRAALEQTRILLVLIGPDWFVEDPDSGRRLVDREDDWVRREIRRAFERGIPVVQVLLDGAEPVEATQLPTDIARLAHSQAAHINHRTLGDDVRVLADRISTLVPELMLPDLFEPERRLPSDPLPSMLLQPDYGVVEFERTDDELPRLVDWLLAPERLVAHLLTGPGGQGKTRLGHRLVEQMRADGWAAGLLADGAPQAVLDRIHAFRGPLLIVVDYAEGRTEQLAVVASQLIARPAEHGPSRLLLLARSSGVWPHLLRRHRDDRVSLFFTDLTERELPSVVAAPDTRPFEYARALRAFAARLDRPTPVTAPPGDLTTARYDRVLDVHAAALAALLDQTASDTSPARRDPLLRVLDHERRYWALAALPNELPSPSRLRHDQVVSAATLFTAPSPADARSLLKALPTFDGEGHNVVAHYQRWLDALYSGPSALNPLRPDRLGEDLVAATLLDQPEFAAWSAPGVGDVQITRALTVLGRAAPRHPHVAETMKALLAEDPAARLPLAIAVATQLQDTALVRVLSEVSATAAGAGVDLEDAVVDHLPDSSLALAAFMVVSTRAALDAERRKEAPDAETVATLTHNLSCRLTDVNQSDQALTYAAQAVEMYSELVASDADFTPELGLALTTLANAYARSGFFEDGLDKATRSCTLLSEVVDTAPTHGQIYATALTTRGNLLSDLARHAEAVAVLEHAVRLTTVLHDEAPDEDRVEYQFRLASALQNLSAARAGAGLHHAGLAAAEESVRLYRELDAFSRDRFRAAWVEGMGNLSGALSELGRVQDAADVAADAVRAARDLVDRHGEGHLSLLADVLNNNGAALRRLGRHEEAIEQLTATVDICRTLATVSPGTHLASLAGALHNLGDCLLDTRQLYRAQDVYDESIDIYRKLAEPRPEANEPELVESLLAQADVLQELEEYEDAFALAAEAAAILYRLAASGQAALRRQLAKALRLMALIHDDMGRVSEALDSVARAAEILAELSDSAAVDLPHVRLEWAIVLYSHGRILSGGGSPDRAVERFREATEVLTEDGKVADTETLGMVLHNHAECLSELGCHEEALGRIEEAVRVRRGLDQKVPANRLALCQSLNNLADTLKDNQRNTEALHSIEEAVELASALRDEDEGETLVYTLLTRASLRTEDEVSAVADLVRAWRVALTAQDDDFQALVRDALAELDELRPDSVRQAWRASTGEPYPLPRP